MTSVIWIVKPTSSNERLLNCGIEYYIYLMARRIISLLNVRGVRKAKSQGFYII